MKMLRKWDGDSNDTILEIIKKFGVEAEKINIIKYESITPDSFIWFFTSGNDQYCLFAQDYISGIDQVKNAIQNNLPDWIGDAKFELVEVISAQKWAGTSPVRSASFYRKPEKPEEIMKYATTSGFDFVFLAINKST